MSETNVDRVLALYPQDCRPRRAENLGAAGGFSGAAFWRLQTERGTLCLRRWPQQRDTQWPDRLGFIHAVLEHVVRHGFSLVPVPIRTRQRETYVQVENDLWEVTTWLPGQADYFPTRKPEKLRAALSALAEFHCAAATFNWAAANLAGSADRLAPSPGICRRRKQIETLRSGGLGAIASAIGSAPRPSAGVHEDDWILLRQLARRILPLYAQAKESVLRQLLAAEPQKIPLQPCIRDIWHDHVLFEGDRVSGLVDFGAMQLDNIAGDIARLLGSFAQEENTIDASVWQIGLAAYETIRHLSADERRLVGVFDHSQVLLAGINWLEWIFLERKTFANFEAVVRRLTGIVARLERLTQG